MGVVLFITIGALILVFAIVYYNQQRSPEQEIEDQLLGEDHDFGTDDVVDLVDEIEAPDNDEHSTPRE